MRDVKALVAVVAVGSMAAVLTGCSSFRSADLTMEQSAKAAAHILVPEQLPTGYRWSGPDLVGTENSTVTAQSSIFVPYDTDRLPVVEICTESSDRDICPQGDVQLLRVNGGQTTKIALSGPEASSASTRGYWDSVPLLPVEQATWVAER